MSDLYIQGKKATLFSRTNLKKAEIKSKDNIYSNNTQSTAPILPPQNQAQLKEVKYSLDKKIGNGALGIVYQGIDLKTHQSVAIKSINDCDDSLKILEKEAKVFEEIKRKNPHPKNLIGYYGTEKISNNERFALVMELADNIPDNSLDKLYLKKQTDPDNFQFKQHMKQVLNGIKELNGAGFIHKDIKGANILLVNGEAKITDFGTCSDINNNEECLNGEGTPYYCCTDFAMERINDLPPINEDYDEEENEKEIEQKSNEIFVSIPKPDLNSKIDMLSFGVMMYEMIYGKGNLPYLNESNLIGTREVIKHSSANNKVWGYLMYTKINNPQICLPENPELWQELLFKLLQKKPEDRFSIDQALAHPYFNGV